MTHDEFVLARVQRDAVYYAKSYRVLLACLAASAVLAAAAFFARGAQVSAATLVILGCLAAQLPQVKAMRDNAEVAAKELAARSEKPEAPLSAATRAALELLPKTAKELKGAWVTYLVLAVLLGCTGALLFVLGSAWGVEPAMLVGGAVCLGGAVLLGALAARTHHDYVLAREFEA